MSKEMLRSAITHRIIELYKGDNKEEVVAVIKNDVEEAISDEIISLNITNEVSTDLEKIITILSTINDDKVKVCINKLKEINNKIS